MFFLWNTHVFSMTTLKTLEEIPCINHGNYMENLCHGCSILDIIKAWPYSKIPWKLHGIMVLTMKNPRYSHGYAWIFPWIFYGTDHGAPWDTGPWIFHGKPMEYFCWGQLRFVQISWPVDPSHFTNSNSLSTSIFFLDYFNTIPIAVPSCCYLSLRHTGWNSMTLLLLINFVHCLAATSQLRTHSFKIQNTRSPCRHTSLSITIQAATSNTKQATQYIHAKP